MDMSRKFGSEPDAANFRRSELELMLGKFSEEVTILLAVAAGVEDSPLALAC